ncbi:MAG: thiopeptide-type bacteriocin biosynthesis protein [Lentimicrobiaceae bacterium]|nr:thiopeptide-type bacteriocin biosynthesis protein [Lentimicrobiaceae bacterium]
MIKKRTFIPGDEWLYFKVYTGFKTADTILTETIFPLSQSLLKQNLINHWFFIRYSDPQFHLRIRFHVVKNENITPIIHHFNAAMQHYIIHNLAWKIQTDTYQREIERYGIELIELSEKLFSLSSEMICKAIDLKEVQQDETLRWLLGLKMIDTLLTDFNYSLQEKCNLLNTLQENFGKEFNINTDSRRQFGQKYRAEKNRIEKILDKNSEHNEEYISLFQPILEGSEKSKYIIEEIKSKISETESPSLNELLSSYTHMTLNRLFRTQQRTHELILYDYLFRYYNSLKKRENP